MKVDLPIEQVKTTSNIHDVTSVMQIIEYQN